MDGDANRDAAHETYHVGLRNQRAMEMQAIELCNRQVERLVHYPEMKARLHQHALESEQQVQRLDAILARHGAAPSALKDTVTSVMGNVAAAVHIPASDEILKNTFANYAFEHYEMAAYTSLIAMAEAVGDAQSVAPLQQSLAEEKAMGEFIKSQIMPTTARFLELTRTGESSGV